MRFRLPTGAALAFAAALASAPAAAADVHVHVMISAGFYGVYAELAPAFGRASGHHLLTTRGPSVGDSPEAIPNRLARGETADVVILDDAPADALGGGGLVQPGSKVEFARPQIGMVVKEGAPRPDIASVGAFRDTLLAARSIGYSDSTSGTYLVTTLFGQLGVADQVLGKSRKVRGPPSGEPVAAVVARGEVDIGFQQVSELQPRFSYSGALTTAAREPDAARALIRFIASPDAAAAIARAGLAPIVAPK